MNVLLMGAVCGIGIGIAMARFAFDSMLRRADKKLKDECDHLRAAITMALWLIDRESPLAARDELNKVLADAQHPEQQPDIDAFLGEGRKPVRSLASVMIPSARDPEQQPIAGDSND